MHSFADVGQPAVRENLEALEKSVGGGKSTIGGPFEPVERTRVPAPRNDVDHRTRKIDALHVGFAVRAQTIACIPRTSDDAGRFSAGAAGALIGRVRGDPLHL